MKVRLPRIVQDPLVGERKKLAVERFEVEDGEAILLDGPVSERVAVVDYDHGRGALAPGARLEPPPPGRVLGRYAVDEQDPWSREFNQVSVFATVLRTMQMFEEPDALGRPLTWAFGAPQLLVIPRAGERARAFYRRETHSLQFFYFPSQRPSHQGRTVFSSLSQDIVAHETGHAILDGIAPDLYHATTPQSLGLHEAIADLTALLMAFRSRVLSRAVLEETGGSIRDSQLFSSLAEEYAQGRDRLGRVGFLRSLDSEKTLDPNAAPENRVSRHSPHQLAEVLTGALYPLMLELFEDRQKQEATASGRSTYEVSGRALWIAAERFKRMLLRALDYLPPGEVSFADYGRAILASDQASHPEDGAARTRLRHELARRHVVRADHELEVETDFEHESLHGVDLARLAASDWAAYEFANRHRGLLGIPADRPFRVRPRLDVAKTYFHDEGRRDVRELIFKVSWDEQEDNGPARLPARRQVHVGTTLALDWETRRIRALLSSDRSAEQREDRDGMLAKMMDSGELRLDENGPEGVAAESSGELMRLRRSASLLHAPAGRPIPTRPSCSEAPRLTPPAGVDAGAFFNLARSSGWR